MSNSLTVVSGLTAVIPSATSLGNITSTQITGAITASNGGTARTAVNAGYVLLSDGTTTLAQVPYSSRLIAYSTAVSFLASGDQLLTMTSAGTMGAYCIRRVTWGLPVSGALATTLGVALLRTGPTGGGSAITGALVMTGLSATTAFLDQAVTLASAVTTSTQLYINVTTTATTAPASSLFVYADSFGV